MEHVSPSAYRPARPHAVFLVLSLALLFCLLPAATRADPSGMDTQARPGYRAFITFDQLTPDQHDELSRLERIYFEGIKNEALKLLNAHFDTHTVISTFGTHVRILRQRNREQLKDIERFLYRAGLREEFVDGYVNRLREDVADYAMDALLLKSKGLLQRR